MIEDPWTVDKSETLCEIICLKMQVDELSFHVMGTNQGKLELRYFSGENGGFYFSVEGQERGIPMDEEMKALIPDLVRRTFGG